MSKLLRAAGRTIGAIAVVDGNHLFCEADQLDGVQRP